MSLQMTGSRGRMAVLRWTEPAILRYAFIFPSNFTTARSLANVLSAFFETCRQAWDVDGMGIVDSRAVTTAKNEWKL